MTQELGRSTPKFCRTAVGARPGPDPSGNPLPSLVVVIVRVFCWFIFNVISTCVIFFPQIEIPTNIDLSVSYMQRLPALLVIQGIQGSPLGLDLKDGLKC